MTVAPSLGVFRLQPQGGVTVAPWKTSSDLPNHPQVPPVRERQNSSLDLEKEGLHASLQVSLYPMPTRHQLRLVNLAAELREEPATPFEERTFSPRELIQATLPHSQPKGDPPVWLRENGNYALSIRPGFVRNERTGVYECIGYPYGSLPRLLLCWITSEAIAQRGRKLELGSSLNTFLRSLGLNPATGGGPRGDAKRLHNQMERLFRASISFDYSSNRQRTWLNMEITSEGLLWWDPATPDQFSLWGSWIVLGERFYEAITAHPVPLDLRVLRALKKSPLALDLYALLVYKSYLADRNRKSFTIPWNGLREQIGGEYARMVDFRRAAREALRAIAVLHPAPPFDEVERGLEVRPGRLLIAAAKLA